MNDGFLTSFLMKAVFFFREESSFLNSVSSGLLSAADRLAVRRDSFHAFLLLTSSMYSWTRAWTLRHNEGIRSSLTVINPTLLTISACLTLSSSSSCSSCLFLASSSSLLPGTSSTPLLLLAVSPTSSSLWLTLSEAALTLASLLEAASSVWPSCFVQADLP